MKVATRNNLLKKLANSKWGTNARTIRTTALALCYSTAEYAAPVWARSSHANKLNPVLNQSCRSITGCLKPTNVEDLYLIAGIAPPDIRREVCARVERTKQTKDERHSLFGHRGVPRIWEGGGPRNFFFRFGNLHVAKRHAAHGEAMRIARGVRGHAPPRNFFKTVQFGAF